MTLYTEQNIYFKLTFWGIDSQALTPHKAFLIDEVGLF